MAYRDGNQLRNGGDQHVFSRYKFERQGFSLQQRLAALQFLFNQRSQGYTEKARTLGHPRQFQQGAHLLRDVRSVMPYTFGHRQQSRMIL
ncbi:hypothetical protein FQZ97_779920 [compost metagenome]